jgi:hypothetical protein
MRESRTGDSPSPRRRHAKTSIATLGACCALAAGAQALVPASAGAMVSQETGGCFAIPKGAGLIEWRTSGGVVCAPTGDDYLRVMANGGFGDRYLVTNPPDRFAGLDLPDNRAGGIPDREGQHFGDGPRLRWPIKVPGRKSPRLPGEGKGWVWKKTKPPKARPLTPSAAAKALKELKSRLSQDCLKLLEDIEKTGIDWMESGVRTHQLTAGKTVAEVVAEMASVLKDFEGKQANAVTRFALKCLDRRN